METEKLEQQVAGVERCVAFLKQEHLAMLTGLQLEISRLKRRCNELNCELDARFPQGVAAEERALAARRRASERLLEEQALAGGRVRAALRARQVRAWALGRALRGDERRFLEELKRRSHMITALGRQLYRQTLTSTALGLELRGARLQLYRRRHEEEGEEEEGEEEGEEEEEEEEEEEGEEGEEGEEDQCTGGARREAAGQQEAPYEMAPEEEEWEFEEEEDSVGGGEGSDWPPPPPPSQSDELCARHASVREQRVRACVPCERVTCAQRPQAMPDPALFLVPLRYRLLRWKRPMRSRGTQEAGLQDEWEDVVEDDGGGGAGVRRRVDMGAAEGETAL